MDEQNLNSKDRFKREKTSLTLVEISNEPPLVNEGRYNSKSGSFLKVLIEPSFIDLG